MALLSFRKKTTQEYGHDPKPLKGRHNHHEGESQNHGDEEGWLISYADMMTLLCAFFVMMFSMANLEKQKFEKVRKEITESFGGEYESSFSETQKFLTQILDDQGVKDVSVRESEPGELQLVFSSHIFFEPGSTILTGHAFEVFQKLSEAMLTRQEKDGPYQITIEGHTDQTQITSGFYASNWELSAIRATALARSFIQKGFSPEQVIPIGFGDSRPMVPPRDEAGAWIEENLNKNRRIEIKVTSLPKTQIPNSN